MSSIRGTEHVFDNGVDPKMTVRVCWWTSFDDCYKAYVEEKVRQGDVKCLSKEEAQTRFDRNNGWGWTAMAEGVVHVVEGRVMAPKSDRKTTLLPLFAHELVHLYINSPTDEENEQLARVVANIVQMAQQMVK